MPTTDTTGWSTRRPRRWPPVRFPWWLPSGGRAWGGGLGLALTVDLRYAVDDPLFSVPPGRLGIGYPLDAVERLVATVGRATATDLLLTARRFDAGEAHRIGLVHEVVTDDRLDDLVAERCATIASLAPMTLRAALADACFHSADLVEGITAFRKSRRPEFRNR